MIILLIPVLFLIINFAAKIFKRVVEKKGKKYYSSFCFLVVLGYLILTAVGVCVIGFSCEWDLRASSVFAIIILNLFLSFLYTYIYFLPYLIANKKKHPQTRAIYILNIFAGWTILAWFIALIWSCTEAQNKIVTQPYAPRDVANELAKYKVLCDDGVITQEEFEQKKKQLLNL